MKNIIVVGDRVLIKPKKETEQTRSGLYLPPGYSQKELLQEGFVIQVGPGYPIPSDEIDEPWKAGAGDNISTSHCRQNKVIWQYFCKNAVEVMIEDEKYFIVPQNAILLLQREE